MAISPVFRCVDSELINHIRNSSRKKAFVEAMDRAVSQFRLAEINGLAGGIIHRFTRSLDARECLNTISCSFVWDGRQSPAVAVNYVLSGHLLVGALGEHDSELINRIRHSGRQTAFLDAMETAVRDLELRDTEEMSPPSSLTASGAGSHSAGHSNVPLASSGSTVSERARVRATGGRAHATGHDHANQQDATTAAYPGSFRSGATLILH